MSNISSGESKGSGIVAPVVLAILDGWGHRLEEENNALEQEHLVMLKKQDQMGTKGQDGSGEQSTMLDSKTNINESSE